LNYVHQMEKSVNKDFSPALGATEVVVFGLGVRGVLLVSRAMGGGRKMCKTPPNVWMGSREARVGPRTDTHESVRGWKRESYC